MKKFIISILILILLVGCSSEKANSFEVNSFAIDMSSYRGVSSTNHNFRGISPEELARIIEEDGSALVFLGYKTCSVCQEVAQYLQEAASELDVTVYYLDCYSEKYPLSGEAYDLIINVLDPILDVNENGEKTIYTPHFFSIVNGELNEGYISVTEGWIYGNPSDSQIDKLISIYQDIMKPFVE